MRKTVMNKRGITLIALVVTIIVLIILAGMSISLVLGDNGIITKAKVSKRDTKEAMIKEEVEMILGEIYIEKQETVTLDDVKLWIGNNKTDIGIIDNRPEQETMDLYYKDYVVTLSDKPEIIEISKAEFQVNIEKEVMDSKITIRASVISDLEELTVTSIKLENQTQNGNEATFELAYSRNISSRNNIIKWKNNIYFL